MNAPDLTNVHLPFEPVSYFVAGDFDPAALIETLKKAPGLADFDDEQGNRQGAVRLDGADDGTPGYWATVPSTITEATVQAAAAAYEA